MALIEYIGRKPKKEDNIAGTGTWWLGQGDVQEIADPVAAAKLLAYDTVWRRAAEPEGRKGIPKPPDPGTSARKADAPQPLKLVGANGEEVILSEMDDAQLRAFVKEKLHPSGIAKDVDLRAKGDNLRGAIYESVRKGIPKPPDPGTTTGAPTAGA